MIKQNIYIFLEYGQGGKLFSNFRTGLLIGRRFNVKEFVLGQNYILNVSDFIYLV